ncbi:MAG: DUF2125 domain-containing protein [Stellaceae bacterium]
MRRSSRFGLAAVIVLLVLVGAYTAYWRIVAGQIQDGLVSWQQAQKAHKIDATWQGLRIAGFPFEFRVAIEDATLRDGSWNPAPELRLARLAGTARPWNFHDWRLSAPDGFLADLASTGGRPELKLLVKSAIGTVAVGSEGAAWIWVRGQGVVGEAAETIPIKSADAWITLPAHPASKDTDPSFGLALSLRQVGVPEPPPEFSKSIDELAVGVTVKGALPGGPLPHAVAAWRDAGGTIEVNSLHLQWGELGVDANGTLALDHKLQPVAAFSGGVEGFGAIFDALVAADRMTPEQASIVKIALTSLAKAGPDGKPQLTVPFTIQNGKMYLGPARLGSVPQINWD